MMPLNHQAGRQAGMQGTLQLLVDRALKHHISFLFDSISLDARSISYVFHVTITDVNNVSQIPLCKLFSDLQGTQPTDTEGFDFVFEHYEQKLHLHIVLRKGTTFAASEKAILTHADFLPTMCKRVKKVQVSVQNIICSQFTDNEALHLG